MKTKTTLVVIMTLVMMFTLVSCEEATQVVRLGTSNYTIELPEGFAETEIEFEEDQVAYWYQDDVRVDLDIYQWEKSEGSTLESEAAYSSESFGTTYEPVTINGIEGMLYISNETYEDLPYVVYNYMFDAGDTIVEVCFWTDNEDTVAEAEEIIATLKAE